MNEDKIRQIATDVFNSMSNQSQFNVASIPVHTHNGTDTVKIPPTSVINFVSLPANNISNNTAGVPDPRAGVLSDDNISPFVDALPTVTYPLTVIEGFAPGSYSNFNGGDAPLGTTIGFYDANTLGTVAQLWMALEASHTTELDFTGTVVSGATSATLAVIWIWQSGAYTVKFSNGNIKQVTFTNGATTATWTGGLTSNSTKTFNVDIFTQWFGVDLTLTS